MVELTFLLMREYSMPWNGFSYRNSTSIDHVSVHPLKMTWALRLLSTMASRVEWWKLSKKKQTDGNSSKRTLATRSKKRNLSNEFKAVWIVLAWNIFHVLHWIGFPCANRSNYEVARVKKPFWIKCKLKEEKAGFHSFQVVLRYFASCFHMKLIKLVSY